MDKLSTIANVVATLRDFLTGKTGILGIMLALDALSQVEAVMLDERTRDNAKVRFRAERKAQQKEDALKMTNTTKGRSTK